MKREPITDGNQSCLSDESRLMGIAEERLFPETPQEVAQILCDTQKAGKKLTVRGGATGLVGGCVPQGGVVMDLSRLTNLGPVQPKADYATIQAECGVTLADLEKAARAKGFCFPPNPTEQTATLGGAFATNAAGPNGLFYGPVSSYVMTLDWAVPGGEIWHIRRGEYTVSAGTIPLPDGRTLSLPQETLPVALYQEGMDLIDLLAGTEGTLGVAVSMEVKLLPEPGDLWGVVFFFETLSGCEQFGEMLLEQAQNQTAETHWTTAEFYDSQTLHLLTEHAENPLLAKLPPFPQGIQAALYVELEGPTEEETSEALMELLDCFAACGGKEENTWAENGSAALQKFRDMRHAVPSLLNETDCTYGQTNSCRWETNFSASPEKFAQYLDMYYQALQAHQLKGMVYGHLLENHLHLALLPTSAQEQQRCEQLVQGLAKAVVDGGGLLVTEYGVGRVHRELVGRMLSPQAKQELTALCRVFDPDEMMAFEE